MPIDGLVACVRYWRQVLEGASEGAANTWEEKIEPIVRTDWPAVNTKVTPSTVEGLTLLVSHTREAFPKAVRTLLERSLLEPLAKPGMIIRSLAEVTDYDYASNHPQETINLIDQSIDLNTLPIERDKLRAILDRARRADAVIAIPPKSMLV